MRLELGKQARLADGGVRDLVDLVIDGVSNRVTHVVVEAKNGSNGGPRLVPMQLVEDARRPHEISLSCTAETLDLMEPVRTTALVSAGESDQPEPGWDIGIEEVQPVQYGGGGLGEIGPDFVQDVFVTHDRIPKGEIELRHASDVYSADRHHLGQVDGVVVSAEDRITYLLLERGHLWWRRELAVPADAVAKFETDMVVLRVSKQQLRAAVAAGA